MHLSYQIKELKAVQSKYSKGCYCCVASMKPSNSEGEPLVALAKEVEPYLEQCNGSIRTL
jgi:hypothetical protein